jgi:purine nucleoside phosphorylase
VRPLSFVVSCLLSPPLLPDPAHHDADPPAACADTLPLPEGTYAYVSGPTYETPAEGRLLRAAGADVVGMSTVPEVLAARQEGVDVVVLSLVTNRVVVGAKEDAWVGREVLDAVRASLCFYSWAS